MEPTIRRLLLAWLVLLGGVLLAQQLGHTQLAYRLLWAVAIGSPVVAVFLLWLAGLRLREAWRRWLVLRRAAKWKRKEPVKSADWWP